MVATAIGTYAELANVKARLNIADVADDAFLQRVCDQVNQTVETKTGRILAPIAQVAYTFDGADAIEGGRLLPIPIGIRAIAQLEIALYTGAAFSIIPATDYFLRPTPQERDPGWPATELWLTDLPSANNPVPFFPPGFANVRVTATWGWPAEPDDIIELAESLAVRRWQARQSGQNDQVGTDQFGEQTISRLLSRDDWHTLMKYAIKSIEID
jgi:hypothetical protein